ncbi:MAG: hypothetical protein HGA39_04925 [Coriobacteriia bacterium]|nr:hypothetical protein [Coriobacteriia bacterium]
MDQSVSPVRVEEIEAALAEVGDIKAARIVASPDGVIQEIHVLASPSKQPKQLVRDIESTLMAQFGIPVDHKKISIAMLGREALRPIEEETVAAEPQLRAERPRITEIQASISGVQASAAVTLDICGTEYVGTADGPASQTGRLRQVALAALDAVSQYTEDTVSFALEDVSIVQMGRERVAVSCIALVSGFGERTFCGSALVRQNENDAIVKATLDAINRRMGFLTTK